MAAVLAAEDQGGPPEQLQQQPQQDQDEDEQQQQPRPPPPPPAAAAHSPFAPLPPPPARLLQKHQPAYSQPLPPGPATHLLRGVFEEGHPLAGLQYYVRGCAKPRRRAALSLAVRVGSVLERDDERGLAHVLEHLAFASTRKFQRHALVDFLESIGAEFGACSNAYTSADETVYQLTVPLEREGEEEEEEEEEEESGEDGDGSDDEDAARSSPSSPSSSPSSPSIITLPPALDQAIEILAQFAFAVRCAPEDLERERGPVLDELRGTRDANGRQSEAHFKQLVAGTRYAERLPIGLESVVRTAPAERVLGFYRRWYRPDAMVVVVAGDFRRPRPKGGRGRGGRGGGGAGVGGRQGRHEEEADRKEEQEEEELDDDDDPDGAPDRRFLDAVAQAIARHFGEAHGAAVAEGHLSANPGPTPEPPPGPLPLRLPAAPASATAAAAAVAAGGADSSTPPLLLPLPDDPAEAEAAIQAAREASLRRPLWASPSSCSSSTSTTLLPSQLLLPHWPPPRCAAYSDREASSSAAYAAFVSSAAPLDSVAAFRRRLADDLLSVALSSRLYKLSRRGDAGAAPFFGADASASPEALCAAAECRVLSAAARDGRTLESLESLLEECARVRCFGLSERELDDARLDLLAENETTYKERHQGHAADYRDELVRHALWGEFAVGQGLEARLAARMLPEIEEEEVRRRAWSLHPAFAPGGVALKTVDGSWRPKHSPADMRRVLERVLAREARGELEPWQESSLAADGGGRGRGGEEVEEAEDEDEDDDDDDDEEEARGAKAGAPLAAVAAVAATPPHPPPAAAPPSPLLLDGEPEAPPMDGASGGSSSATGADGGGLPHPPSFVARCRPLPRPVFPKGSVEWVLRNGVRVAFVPTTFSDDEVLVTAVAVGGLTEAIAEDEDKAAQQEEEVAAASAAARALPPPPPPPPGGAFSSTRLSANLANALGCWGGHPPERLHDLLAGKRLSVDLGVGAFSRSLAGSASPADLADAFRLAHALLTRPVVPAAAEAAATAEGKAKAKEEEGAKEAAQRKEAAGGGNPQQRQEDSSEEWRSASLASALAQLRQSLAARARDPASRYRDAARRACYGDECAFFSPLREADVEAAARDGAAAAVARFNSLFSGSAADFAFVVVGATTADRLLPLVGRYLSTLPAAAPPAAGRRLDARRVAPIRFAFPPGPPPVRVAVPCRMSHSSARSCHAQITWPLALPRATARDAVVWSQLAARVLERRLLRAMRFDGGETYGVTVSTFYGAEAPSAPADKPVRGELTVAFTCEPAARERLLELGVRTLAALQGGAEDGDNSDDRPPTAAELATALRLERLSWEESQETNSFWSDVLSTAFQSRQYAETEEANGGSVGDGDVAAVHARTLAARKTVRARAAADPLALRAAVREILPWPCDQRYASVAMVPKPRFGGGGVRSKRWWLLLAAAGVAAAAWAMKRGGCEKGDKSRSKE
jgi:predicted Zn-dependent peptidase